ncbi:MAG: hypothetical protein AB7E08_03070 [Candidatus Omnitrophota bacterium]
MNGRQAKKFRKMMKQAIEKEVEDLRNSIFDLPFRERLKIAFKILRGRKDAPT